MTDTLSAPTRAQLAAAVIDLAKLVDGVTDWGPLEAGLLSPGNDPIAAQSLLAVPDVLNTFRRNNDLSVTQGTTFMVRKCRQVKGWPDICSGVERPEHKCTDDCWEAVQMKPFLFYDIANCHGMGDMSWLAQAAQGTVVEGTPWAISKELEDGALTGNPSFKSHGVDVTPPSGAVDIIQGLQILTNSMRFSGHGLAVYHGASELLTELEDRQIARYTQGGLRITRNQLFNPGPGLTGCGPGGIDMTADGEFYLWASAGMGEYNVAAPSEYLPLAESSNPRTNQLLYEAMRRAVLRFNPYCLYGVRVCLKKTSCCEGTKAATEKRLEKARKAAGIEKKVAA